MISDFIDRYQSYPVDDLGYATVKDFNDSRENLPELCQLNGDLKNVQRPWIVKAIASKIKSRAKLLEIGAGEPLVADYLYNLGYDVTIVDPYDGTGNGPTEYDAYKKNYPHIKIIKKNFDSELTEISAGTYDCIYSVSVLEHVPDSKLGTLFEGIRKFINPRGVTIHAIDHVLLGDGDKAHDNKLRLILKELSLKDKLDSVLDLLREDVETYFLSAEGHLYWKGTIDYNDFPFRRVVSMQVCRQMP